MKKFRVLSIGEILWDIIEGDAYLGGAPFNFSCFINFFGHEGIMISRIGQDSLGAEILSRLANMGLNTEYIQKDDLHPTGTVLVTLDKDGHPSYQIVEDVAYDYLETDGSLDSLAGSVDAICFGTLAQRASKTRKAIHEIVRAFPDAVSIYDINLRQEFYSASIVGESLEMSNILKTNEEELQVLKDMFGKKKMSNEEITRYLLDTFSLKLVCVTCGEAGCLLTDSLRTIDSPGYKVEVADTVGSGDAFTAALVLKYLENAPLEEIAQFANLAGAYVASQRGATPEVTPRILDDFQQNVSRRE